MLEKSKIPVVYVARHGTTLLNAENCFRGRNDVSLDAEGKRDAHRLAFYFEPIEVSLIVASDRKRADETADVIAQKKGGMEVYSTKALRAWNVGVYSGQEKTPEVVQEFERYVKDPSLQIPEGESLDEFKTRVRPALLEACQIGLHRGIPVLIVSHSSVIHECGSMFHGDHEAVLVEPGGAIEISMTEDGLMAAPVFKVREEATNAADTVS